MENQNNSQNSDNQSVPISSDTPKVVEVVPEKTHRKLSATDIAVIVVVSLASVIVIGSLILLTILFINKGNGDTNDQNTVIKTSQEEISLEEEAIISDINAKIDALNFSPVSSGNYFVGNSWPGRIFFGKEISSSNLSPGQKITAAITLGKDKFTEYTGRLENSVSSNHVISEAMVMAYYKELFGEDMVILDDTNTCPNYRHLEDANAYYQVACTGEEYPYKDVYYKYRYTTQGDKIYVYYAAGSYNETTHKAYTDAISGAAAIGAPIDYRLYRDLSQDDYNSSTNYPVIITDTNYQSFAPYRFVFGRSDTGAYAFLGIEKV